MFRKTDREAYIAKYLRQERGGFPAGALVGRRCRLAPHQPGPGLLDRDGLITPAELAAFLALPIKTLRDWRHGRAEGLSRRSARALRTGRGPPLALYGIGYALRVLGDRPLSSIRNGDVQAFVAG